MLDKAQWPAPPRDLKLEPHQVHVWCADVQDALHRIGFLRSTLSSDEHKRAQRFYFDRDRERFIVGRGLLRVVLGRYLGRSPEKIRFSYNRYGKPALAERSAAPAVAFNLSHAGSLVFCAFTRNRAVGVDIEPLRRFANAAQLVERFFSDREKRVFRSLPESRKAEAFFTCWTRKEAYIKALGKGLSMPLNQFSVTFGPDEPAKLMHTSADSTSSSRWFLKGIRINARYIAAVVVEGDRLDFCQWRWA
jgi:4'-phosphopantetheinyl transferase